MGHQKMELSIFCIKELKMKMLKVKFETKANKFLEQTADSENAGAAVIKEI